MKGVSSSVLFAMFSRLLLLKLFYVTCLHAVQLQGWGYHSGLAQNNLSHSGSDNITHPFKMQFQSDYCSNLSFCCHLNLLTYKHL